MPASWWLPLALVLWRGGAGPAEAVTSCHEYYGMASVRSTTARAWCEGGGYFNFTSALNGGRRLRAFYRCSGDRAKPAVVLAHGYPTSSFDFRALVSLLAQDFFMCTADYIGYGFSDKPLHPFRYSIFEHAQLLEELVTRVVRLPNFALVSHDEGDSVGLELLRRHERDSTEFRLTHHILLNGNMYLPLAHLTRGQKALLSNATGPLLQRLLPGRLLASSLGSSLCSPKLSHDEQTELATVFDYQGGTHVMHETIQYLVERREFEEEWLDALQWSHVPATLIWGQTDPVAVPGVGDYVWQRCLQNRTTAPAQYHRLDAANHYLQMDHPADVADIVRKALGTLPLSVPSFV